MYRLKQKFSIPEAELACDDVLLDLAEKGEIGECFRLWKAEDAFVVLGRGNTYKTEVDLGQCKADGVSVFRRQSGGGTILQMPGVLNCTLILDMEARPELKHISKSNCIIMSWFKDAFKSRAEGVSVRGYSDLCVFDKKVMGTAQRRLRRFVLFHGSLLVDCDLSLISKYLSHPSKEPGYRAGRDHSQFLTTLPFSVSDAESVLEDYFVCDGDLDVLDMNLVNKKIQDSYACYSWNFRL
jgi:lipoate---protein ligase